MYTEKELLQWAGKLAIACQELLNGDVKDLGYHINKLTETLDNYNNAIMSNTNES